jgi:type VI secretion system protein ImpJ
LLSTQDLSGYEVLPIAQIRRASEEQAIPRIDPDYIPPVVSIIAWPPLGRDIVRAIYDIIGQKIEVLSLQISNRGIGLEGRDPGDLDRIMMLAELNVAFAALAVLAFAQGVHPFVAYTEMCRIVGQLSIFGPKRRTEDIPAYDHDDLAGIFKEIRQRIERLINTVRDYEFEQRYFVGVGMGMQVTLEPKWFNSDWQWYIGVNKGELSEQECRELLSAGQLDWKFGSSRQVEILFKHRAEGLRLNLVDRTIRALPSRGEWIYYEVDRKDSPAWRDVQETQTLAMRLKDTLIVNADRLQGERRLSVSLRGKKVTLQFALFAVPMR